MQQRNKIGKKEMEENTLNEIEMEGRHRNSKTFYQKTNKNRKTSATRLGIKKETNEQDDVPRTVVQITKAVEPTLEEVK